MKRNVSLEEISDGRLYGPNDMVKADCGGCKGCSVCCHGMGQSIILDPLDAYRLSGGLGKNFASLLEKEVELNVVDGVILPNLRMTDSKESCSFLNSEGRCSVHAFRPGVCRLFPLGRYYEGESFRYFLQTGECPHKSRTKIKVSKWIDTPDLSDNQRFVMTWHSLLNEMEQAVMENEDDTFRKNVNLLLLRCFYLTPYETGETASDGRSGEQKFYRQFEKRYTEFRHFLFSSETENVIL